MARATLRHRPCAAVTLGTDATGEVAVAALQPPECGARGRQDVDARQVRMQTR